MRKLNMEEVGKNFGRGKQWGKSSIGPMQIVVYVMCGGGMLGRFAAEQPSDFYIDDRVGRLPYAKDEIYQAVEILKVAAENLGLDPRNMPQLPGFHNMGVF